VAIHGKKRSNVIIELGDEAAENDNYRWVIIGDSTACALFGQLRE